MRNETLLGLLIVLSCLFFWLAPNPSKPPPKLPQQVVTTKPDKTNWLKQAAQHYASNRQSNWERIEYKYYPNENKLSWLVMETSNGEPVYFWLDYHYDGEQLINVTRDD